MDNSFVLSIGDVVGKNSPHQGSMRTIVVRPPKARAFPIEQTMEADTDLWDRTRAYLRLSFEADGVRVDQYVQLICTEPPFRWCLCQTGEINCQTERLNNKEILKTMKDNRYLVGSGGGDSNPRHADYDKSCPPFQAITNGRSGGQECGD